LNYTGEFYGFPNLARFSFFLCDQPFNCFSLFRASCLVLKVSENRILIGLCSNVYFPPLPSLCS